jgi:ribosomal protein S1
MKTNIFVLILMLLSVPLESFSAAVHLRNGELVKGKVISVEKGKITVRISKSRASQKHAEQLREVDITDCLAIVHDSGRVEPVTVTTPTDSLLLAKLIDKEVVKEKDNSLGQTVAFIGLIAGVIIFLIPWAGK